MTYTYDSNGNVIRDDNRGISSIKYNDLGLPSQISLGANSSIAYFYSAAGTKLASHSAEGAATRKAVASDDLSMTVQPYAYIAEDYDYIGNYEFYNGSFMRINTPYGYYFAGDFTPYMRDYQGNIRNSANYYAFGLPTQGSNVSTTDPYLYGGKEFYPLKGINLYDFHARTYAPDIARFMQPDPLATENHGVSPYTFCNGDPINFVDPTGCSTWVMLEPDGRYKVVGGDLNDNDLNIYVVTKQEDGTFIKGSSIGITPVITSFYNSDKGEWAKGSYIDPNDASGKEFISNMTGDNTPGLVDYMVNAGNGGKYDFKVTNGTPSTIDGIDVYRGMPMGKTESGMIIYTSARDIGNMVAGYVATAHALPWVLMRWGFDAYQSYKKSKQEHRIIFEIEGISTRNAEAYGRVLRLTGRYKKTF